MESVYRYLVQRKYFKLVRQLLEEKVPPLYDEVIVSPPNSISDTLLQMIQHPLRLMSNTQRNDTANLASTSTSPLPLISEECVQLILSSFVDEILVPEYTKPIQLFVIPCLANNAEFPFAHLLHYLSDLIKNELIAEHQQQQHRHQHQQNYQQQRSSGSISAHSNNDYYTSNTTAMLTQQQIKSIDCIFSSSYMFHSFLTLNRLHLERIRNNPIWVGDYINVLGSLSRNIRKLQQRSSNPLLRQYDKEFEADDDSDTDEEIERPIQSISTTERDCLTEVISQMNDEKHVEVMLANIDNYLEDVQVLNSLCKICHNLMLYHRTAVFDFQYVSKFKIHVIEQQHSLILFFVLFFYSLVFCVC